MGIKGLLPLVESAAEHVTLSEPRFVGCRVAIDGDGLLYRAAYAYADKLALGQRTDGHVRFVMECVRRMRAEWKLEPVVVFDGERMPLKFEIQEARRIEREARRRKAAMLMLEGREEEAREMLMRCMSVSGRVKQEVISALGADDVSCLVAPFEADAQLTHMSRGGEVDYVISEDSDLLVYGCERVLFKMNYKSGGAKLITRVRLVECVSRWFQVGCCYSNNGLLLAKHDDDDGNKNNDNDTIIFQLFRWTCVLSGCDYLANLPGIGMAKARRLVIACAHEAATGAPTDQNGVFRVERLFALMPAVLGVSAPADYERQFCRAMATFDNSTTTTTTTTTTKS